MGQFSNGLRHTVFGFINFYIKKSKASEVVVLFLDFIFLLKTKQNGKKSCQIDALTLFWRIIVQINPLWMVTNIL